MSAIDSSDPEASYLLNRIDVRVSEAKGLQGFGADNSSSSNAGATHCIVCVDDEEVARTATVQASDGNPFFGAHFLLDLDKAFSKVSVHACATHSGASLGKIVFYRDDLIKSDADVDLAVAEAGAAALDSGAGATATAGAIKAAARAQTQLSETQWRSLERDLPSTSAHGEVYLELLKMGGEGGMEILKVTLVRGRDLMPRNYTGKMDPVGEVKVDGEVKSTRKLKGARVPDWDETFEFSRARLPPTLVVKVVDSRGRIEGAAGYGQVTVPLDTLVTGTARRRWYALRPIPTDTTTQRRSGVPVSPGSVRLSLKLQHTLVLPLASYAPLIDYFAEVVVAAEKDADDAAGVAAALATGPLGVVQDMLDRKALEREGIARALVRMLALRNKSTALVRRLVAVKIAEARNVPTLFRGNSLATKCTDQIMKLVGLRYLASVCKPTVDSIFTEAVDCEIDPDRLHMVKPKKVPQLIEAHAAQLTKYLERLLVDVFNSAAHCPPEMRRVFHHLQIEVRKNPRFSGGDGSDGAKKTGEGPDGGSGGGSGDTSASDPEVFVVSGFLFLRFFAAAVLAPKLFGLRQDLAGPRVGRTLTLMAKTLQTIGNLGTTISSGKEEYMSPLWPFVRENLPRVRAYIRAVCSLEGVPEEGEAATLRKASAPAQADEVLLSSTLLVKRGDTGSFTKRIVRLSHTTLEIEPVKSKGAATEMLQIANISVTEHLDTLATGKRHVIQVAFGGGDGKAEAFSLARVYYLGCASADAAVTWLQALRRAAFILGARPTRSCHSGVFKGGKCWTCCGASHVDAPFCSKAHATAQEDPMGGEAPPQEVAHDAFTMLERALPVLKSRFNPGDTSPLAASALTLVGVLEETQIAHMLLKGTRE